MFTIIQGTVAILYETLYSEETGQMCRFPSAIYLPENWNKSICKHLGGDSIINVQN